MSRACVSCGCFILVVSPSPQFYLLILRARSLNEKKGMKFLAGQDRLVRGHCNLKVLESKMGPEHTNRVTDIVLTSAKPAMSLWTLMVEAHPQQGTVWPDPVPEQVMDSGARQTGDGVVGVDGGWLRHLP